MEIHSTNILLLFVLLIIGIAIGFVFALIYVNFRSKFFRKKHSIPNLLGKWNCKWYDDEKNIDTPKIEDTIEILKWSKDSEFSAIGHQPQFHLSYPIKGEIDPSRVVILEYRAARYPYEPNRGVVCMILSRDGKTMEGKWLGKRSTGFLGGGKVICTRLA